MGEKVVHGKVEGIGGEELSERIREVAGLQRKLVAELVGLGATMRAAMDANPGFVPCGHAFGVVIEGLSASAGHVGPARIREACEAVRARSKHVAEHRGVARGSSVDVLARIERGERTLVTTLTKRMAEDLTAYLGNAGIKTRYMHHDVGAMERMEIIRDLRRGEFDVLVGINLLREGLDLPEVSLIAILDADKEGFLRSETSLIQTIGRAARNAEGTVIMYADTVTPSMRAAIDETERRRAIQTAYNEAHGIVPKTIKKSIRDLLEITGPAAKDERGMRMTERERKAEIDRLEKEMRKAAQMLEYEYAAVLRDQIIRLRGEK